MNDVHKRSRKILLVHSTGHNAIVGLSKGNKNEKLSEKMFVSIPSSFPCKVEELKKMKIGDPLDRSTDHGPQNHKAHMDKLLEYCEVGLKEGATLVYGGKQVDRPGKTHTEPP